jgi:hypothetical protein
MYTSSHHYHFISNTQPTLYNYNTNTSIVPRPRDDIITIPNETTPFWRVHFAYFSIHNSSVSVQKPSKSNPHLVFRKSSSSNQPSHPYLLLPPFYLCLTLVGYFCISSYATCIQNRQSMPTMLCPMLYDINNCVFLSAISC